VDAQEVGHDDVEGARVGVAAGGILDAAVLVALDVLHVAAAAQDHGLAAVVDRLDEGLDVAGVEGHAVEGDGVDGLGLDDGRGGPGVAEAPPGLHGVLDLLITHRSLAAVAIDQVAGLLVALVVAHEARGGPEAGVVVLVEARFAVVGVEGPQIHEAGGQLPAIEGQVVLLQRRELGDALPAVVGAVLVGGPVGVGPGRGGGGAALGQLAEGVVEAAAHEAGETGGVVAAVPGVFLAGVLAHGRHGLLGSGRGGLGGFAAGHQAQAAQHQGLLEHQTPPHMRLAAWPPGSVGCPLGRALAKQTSCQGPTGPDGPGMPSSGGDWSGHGYPGCAAPISPAAARGRRPSTPRPAAPR
jgi:hypothetical protein